MYSRRTEDDTGSRMEPQCAAHGEAGDVATDKESAVGIGATGQVMDKQMEPVPGNGNDAGIQCTRC